MSAFFKFKCGIRDEIQKANPEKKRTEIDKIIAERWKEASPTIKAHYEMKLEEVKRAYEEDMKADEEKYRNIAKC